jgi:hypothetical protein
VYLHYEGARVSEKIQAGPGKKLLENLEGCISTTRELGFVKTRVAIDVSINYTLTKLLVPKMHVF